MDGFGMHTGRGRTRWCSTAPSGSCRAQVLWPACCRCAQQCVVAQSRPRPPARGQCDRWVCLFVCLFVCLKRPRCGAGRGAVRSSRTVQGVRQSALPRCAGKCATNHMEAGGFIRTRAGVGVPLFHGAWLVTPSAACMKAVPSGARALRRGAHACALCADPPAALRIGLGGQSTRTCSTTSSPALSTANSRRRRTRSKHTYASAPATGTAPAPSAKLCRVNPAARTCARAFGPFLPSGPAQWRPTFVVTHPGSDVVGQRRRGQVGTMRPTSRGRLTLRSARPTDAPVVDFNYLATADDVEVTGPPRSPTGDGSARANVRLKSA